MKKLLLALVLISIITGCAGPAVNVEDETCVKRGVIDGKSISKCKISHNVL